MENLKKLTIEEISILVKGKIPYYLEENAYFETRKDIARAMSKIKKSSLEDQMRAMYFGVFTSNKKSFIAAVEGIKKNGRCIGYRGLNVKSKKVYRFNVGDPFTFCGKIIGTFFDRYVGAFLIMQLQNEDCFFVPLMGAPKINTSGIEKSEDQTNLPVF